jgi:hypothetical protein
MQKNYLMCVYFTGKNHVVVPLAHNILLQEPGIGQEGHMLMKAARKNTSKRDWLYNVADNTWTIAGWFWSVVIIAFLVAYAAGLATAGNTSNNFNNFVLQWLSNQHRDHIQEIYRVIAISLIILFISITLLSVILRHLLKPPSLTKLQEVLDFLQSDQGTTEAEEGDQEKRDADGFKHYLRTMKEMNQTINPGGLAPHSRTLIFTDVSLVDTFVHLNAVPDRPIYDLPAEQQRLLKEIEQRPNLTSFTIALISIR